MKEDSVQTAVNLLTKTKLVNWLDIEIEIRNKYNDLYNRKDLPDFKQYYTENSQKAKDYIQCVKNLFNDGRELKEQPIALYYLLKSGYFIAAMIFQLTEHKQQRKFFEKEAINFAKAAEKFEKILGND